MNKIGIRKPTFTELAITLEELEAKMWSSTEKQSRSLEKSIEKIQKMLDDWSHEEQNCSYGQVRKTSKGEKYHNECICKPGEY